jgi:zinc transport system substrate-binding protein
MYPCRRSLPWILGAVLLTLGLGFAGCSRAPDPWKGAKQGQKRILVTFPPLFCLTHAIAGDDAYVLCFLSNNDPHDYQFTAADGVKAKDADLLISNGLDLDDAFVAHLKEHSKAATLKVGEAIPKSLVFAMADDDEDDDKKHDAGKHDAGKHDAGKHDAGKHDPAKHDKNDKDDEGHHHHGGQDPHIWLGPPQAMAIADAINEKLGALDPKHAEEYTKRTAKLKDELKKLHEEGLERFKGKKNRTIVAMHDSMGYFARAFGLDVAGSIQIQPGQDPSGARLAQLEQLCKKRHVVAITFEPHYPKAQSETLQKELKHRKQDVNLAEFDPLETAPLAKDSVNPDPQFYMQKMRANIDNLAGALP